MEGPYNFPLTKRQWAELAREREQKETRLSGRDIESEQRGDE
jgi:hypothetical protein